MVLIYAVLCAGCCATANAIEVRLPQGPHPCVFLTLNERETARERAAAYGWSRKVRESLLRQADGLVAEEFNIPHAEGQWTHWFSCKDDGAGLKSKSPTEHVCPVCGKVYSGYPYDQVYVSHTHRHWLNGLATLGWAYALEPKPAYAQRARAILLEYASFYQDLKLHDVRNRQGRSKARLFAQTLDEAVILCPICVGYDLMYDAPCFSQADHEKIAGGLLRPMCHTIQQNPAGISNWQSWHNAGVGCAGFLLRDAELVGWAINGDNGFLLQMERSVRASGMWYEEAPSYHWYALSAHVYLMETAARAGMDLYGVPVVKKMFDAPMRQLFPDLTFPAFNDSTRHSIMGQRRLYEVAYRRFKAPEYVPLLDPRDSPEALFWGAESVPAATEKLVLTSSNAESEGLAILRDAAGEVAVFLDYARGEAGHSHPARLGVILYAHGDERLVDPGRLPYGNPMHREWYTQTIAHNTIVVGEKSQKKAPAELRAFAAGDKFSLVRAMSDEVYEDVLLDRTVCLFDDVVIDIVRCEAAGPQTFDLPLHFRGELSGLPDGTPLEQIADEPGYRVLKDVRRLDEPPAAFDVETGPQQRINVQVFDSSEVFLATGFGASMTVSIPMVMRRQRGESAVFVTVFQICSEGEQPKPVSTQQDQGTTTVRLDEAEIMVGAETIVTIGNERHVVTGK